MSRLIDATIYIDGDDMDVYLGREDFVAILKQHPSNVFRAVVRGDRA